MIVLPLFSTNIYVKKCDLDIAKLEKYCYDHSLTEGKKNKSSTGYQGYEFYHEEIKNIIIDNIPKKENKEFCVEEIQMWLNINKLHEYHELHDHDPFSGSFLSGVFYVKVPENSGNLRLYDPRIFVTNSPDMKYYNDGHKYQSVIAEENLLIMFPGWLLHSVESSQSNQDRISISFNIKINFNY
jgi:hypothetical protein